MVTLDVLIEILLKLSPESLLRSKLVSKSWNALISDPKFITKHLSISFQQKHLLIKGLERENFEKKESKFSILKFSLDRSVSVFDVHFPFNEDYLDWDIYGHSHGLVCLGGTGDDIFLYNILTRQFRKLPPSIIFLDEYQHEPEDIYSRKYLTSWVTGFGYDAKSKDFKVVRVLGFSDEWYSFPSRVEIYDLSKDRWREIEAPGCGFVDSVSLFDMYHEGKFYWWAVNANLSEMFDIIQTFDISEEVFGKISYPEIMEGKVRDSNKSLGILNGSIVLFDYPFRGNEKTFDIWEMEKDEFGAILWSKLLTIGPVSRVEYPLLFVSSDELLMKCDEGEVILYNIKTGHLKELPLKGPQIPESSNMLVATFFVKSLLSVEGGNVMNYEF